MATHPDDSDDDQLWALHPVLDDDQAEAEARYLAERWAAEAIPAEDPDPDYCHDCGAPLDAEDEPFTVCEACRRDGPKPVALTAPEEMP